jgi:hypothetical protein
MVEGFSTLCKLGSKRRPCCRDPVCLALIALRCVTFSWVVLVRLKPGLSRCVICCEPTALIEGLSLTERLFSNSIFLSRASRQGVGGSSKASLVFLVSEAAGVHPVPSRTRQLSPPAPMVLGWSHPGSVGRRQVLFPFPCSALPSPCRLLVF